MIQCFCAFFSLLRLHCLEVSYLFSLLSFENIHLRLANMLLRQTSSGSRANLRVPVRVYDDEDGAVFPKIAHLAISIKTAWTPRLRFPTPFMAPGINFSVPFGTVNNSLGINDPRNRAKVLCPRLRYCYWQNLD